MANEKELAPVVAATAAFIIGGAKVEVPALNFFILRQAREYLMALDSNMNWIDYADNVLSIVAVAVAEVRPELTKDALARRLSVTEARDLSASLNKLLQISGFDSGNASGEAPAPAEGASPGTGTSTESQPNLPLEESAAGISTISNGAIASIATGG